MVRHADGGGEEVQVRLWEERGGDVEGGGGGHEEAAVVSLLVLTRLLYACVTLRSQW